MEYAIQLLLPILGGLALGMWLTRHYGASPIWTVLLAILGMAGGLGVLYKRFTYGEHAIPRKTISKSVKKSEKPAHPSVPVEDLHFMYQDLDKDDSHALSSDAEKEIDS